MDIEATNILQYVFAGAIETMHPANLLVMFLGLFVGFIGGLLPGISTVTSVALFVPFTFAMPTNMAFIGLGAVFCGAMTGGANSAILINTPGQPASMATAFDGYPMTKNGRAKEALFLALLASAFGGLFGSFILLFFFEPLSMVALQFGSEAFFWMGIFGLTTLASMFPGQTLKALLGGALGLAISTVGLDPATATPRFTFGTFTLVQGLDMVAVMIGLFSISQMLTILESKDPFISNVPQKSGAFRTALSAIFVHIRKLLFSSFLGTLIGALPGAGGNVASIIAYNEAKRWDKNPEKYGKGAPEGVLATESANNASVGGALVPLLSLGIPGSATAAVLAGGLMAQGITPGPQLMEMNPDLAYTFITSLIIANFALILVGAIMVPLCTRILDVPKLYIIPAVITLSLLGSYALRSNMFDVFVMIASGGLAYVLLRGSIMPAAIALGLVLGPIIEESLVITIMRSRNKDLVDLLIFSPLAMFFIIASITVIVLPIFLNRKKQQKAFSFATPSFACLRRYDFWLVLALTVVSGIFFALSFDLAKIPSIFPLFVFGAMIALGLTILALMFFEKKPVLEKLESRTIVNCLIYMGLLATAYFIIPITGFYTACFLCMLSMGFFGIFHIAKNPFTLKSSVRIFLFALGCTCVEYGGFTMLLKILPPQGMFI